MNHSKYLKITEIVLKAIAKVLGELNKEIPKLNEEQNDGNVE